MDYMHSVKKLAKRLEITPIESIHGANDNVSQSSPIVIRISDDLDDVFAPDTDENLSREQTYCGSSYIGHTSQEYTTQERNAMSKTCHETKGNTKHTKTLLPPNTLSSNNLVTYSGNEMLGRRLSGHILVPNTRLQVFGNIPLPQTRALPRDRRSSNTILKSSSKDGTHGRRMSGNTLISNPGNETQGRRMSGSTLISYLGNETQGRRMSGNMLTPYPGNGSYGRSTSSINHEHKGHPITGNCTSPCKGFETQTDQTNERMTVSHPGLGLLKRPLLVSRSMPISPTITTEEMQDKKRCDLKMKIDMLNAELMSMKKNDQELAKRLLNIYSEIRMIKVHASCMKHGELLDEAFYKAELEDEFPDVCDLPRFSMNKLLLNRGVTRLNISARRFSCS